MPNHYLDLSKMETGRFWPNDSIEHDLTYQQAAEKLVPRIGQIMGGI